jgi:hypothetical protein
MGARVIEKNFTYDKNADGPDHMLSADPREMKEIVDSVRAFERMRGSGIKRPATSEKTTRINNRKSLVLARPVRAGERIVADALAVKRPGYGIPPKFCSRWQVAARDIDADDVLAWETAANPRHHHPGADGSTRCRESAEADRRVPLLATSSGAWHLRRRREQSLPRATRRRTTSTFCHERGSTTTRHEQNDARTLYGCARAWFHRVVP